jgi:hypothetical protein
MVGAADPRSFSVHRTYGIFNDEDGQYWITRFWMMEVDEDFAPYGPFDYLVDAEAELDLILNKKVIY